MALSKDALGSATTFENLPWHSTRHPIDSNTSCIHFAEPPQNPAAPKWIQDVVESVGRRGECQGKFSNVVALPSASFDKAILVGAHYDSVPMCPGADDNA